MTDIKIHNIHLKHTNTYMSHKLAAPSKIAKQLFLLFAHACRIKSTTTKLIINNEVPKSLRALRLAKLFHIASDLYLPVLIV